MICFKVDQKQYDHNLSGVLQKNLLVLTVIFGKPFDCLKIFAINGRVIVKVPLLSPDISDI